MNRRDFTKTSLAVTASTALSYTRILGANDRINLSLIGCGDRGMQIWNIFLKQPDANPVAVCDVYKTNADKAAAASAATASGKVAIHEDFQRVLEMKEVDAIVVATPDH